MAKSKLSSLGSLQGENKRMQVRLENHDKMNYFVAVFRVGRGYKANYEYLH